MAETPQNPLAELVREARDRLVQQLQAQGENLQKLEQGLRELRERHHELEGEVKERFEALEKVELPAPPAPAFPEISLERVLAAVRNLMTATLPEQVLGTVTEEAAQMGVRAAVFDVRGKAAWGSAANGFGPQLSQKTFRALVVSLNQDNPFRQVYETGGHVDANLELLKRNRNVLERFKPSPADPILLLPIRSAGSVSAIFYADPGGKRGGLPVEALKILTEFAGAQLDRLMALSGGVPSAEGVGVEPEPVVEPAVEMPVGAEEPALIVEPVSQAETAVAAPAPPVATVPVELPPVEPAPLVAEPLPPPVPPPAPVVEPPVAAVAPPGAPPVAGFDLSQLSEAEQRIHKDAKRFAKLLVSEIDLYNKAKVADGRKNKDLYKRLKSDIDRSRRTFEKRFGKTLAGQFDYFHEEVVRTLAASDPSVLGSDYPGPTA